MWHTGVQKCMCIRGILIVQSCEWSTLRIVHGIMNNNWITLFVLVYYPEQGSFVWTLCRNNDINKAVIAVINVAGYPTKGDADGR
jgi:hypothetical protein